MANCTENFPNLSTYDFDKILCQLDKVCGGDTSGLINYQFLSRPTTAKDIAQLFYCTYEIMKASKSLQDQFVELYNFIKNYVENLDIQKYVNEWLENLKNSGYFQDYVKHLSEQLQRNELSSDNVRTTMYNLIFEWLKYRDAFVYGFPTFIDKNPVIKNGKYAIDCSTFLLMILKGIHPLNTIAYGKDNISSFWYATNNFGYRYTWEIAEWLYNHDLTYKVKPDFSNVKPMDILFQSDGVSNPDVFMKISHCCFFMGNVNGESWIAEGEADAVGNGIIYHPMWDFHKTKTILAASIPPMSLFKNIEIGVNRYTNEREWKSFTVSASESHAQSPNNPCTLTQISNIILKNNNGNLLKSAVVHNWEMSDSGIVENSNKKCYEIKTLNNANIPYIFYNNSLYSKCKIGFSNTVLSVGSSLKLTTFFNQFERKQLASETSYIYVFYDGNDDIDAYVGFKDDFITDYEKIEINSSVPLGGFHFIKDFILLRKNKAVVIKRAKLVEINRNNYTDYNLSYNADSRSVSIKINGAVPVRSDKRGYVWSNYADNGYSYNDCMNNNTLYSFCGSNGSEPYFVLFLGNELTDVNSLEDFISKLDVTPLKIIVLHKRPPVYLYKTNVEKLISSYIEADEKIVGYTSDIPFFGTYVGLPVLNRVDNVIPIYPL